MTTEYQISTTPKAEPAVIQPAFLSALEGVTLLQNAQYLRIDESGTQYLYPSIQDLLLALKPNPQSIIKAIQEGTQTLKDGLPLEWAQSQI